MSETTYSKIAAAVKRTEHDVRKLAETKHLPKTFQQRLVQLAEELRGHSLDQYREPLQEVCGDYTSSADLLMLVKEASDAQKWTVSEHTGEMAAEMGMPASEFRDTFGLNVNDDDVKVYELYRETRNRDLVYMVVASCIPGHVFLTYSTDRVGMAAEAPIANADILTYLKKEVFGED